MSTKNFFANAVKVAISPMQCLTLDKNLALMKFLPTRAGGEIGKISPGKIFLHVHRAGGAGLVGQAKTGPLFSSFGRVMVVNSIDHVVMVVKDLACFII